MNLNIRELNAIPVVDLDGRLDAHQAPQLTDALMNLAKASDSTVLNLTEVHFIDSTGLAALVKIAKHYREKGGDIVLCGLQKPVRIIFEITRLDKVFAIVGTLEDAIPKKEMGLETSAMKA